MPTATGIPEHMNELGIERAERLAEELRQYKVGTQPTENVWEAIRAVRTMANLTLFAWDALQEFVGRGVEGGRATEMVWKFSSVAAMWLANIGVAARIIRGWVHVVPIPFPGGELQNLEDRLQQAHSSAERLLALISGPPPALAEDQMRMVEAAGQADHERECLNAETFLARMRAHKGS
jgi:hypothetical protein